MRAILYLRVSTEEQRDSGTSLDSQRAACEAYARERGYLVAAVYSDSFSAATLDRPQLTLLRQSIRDGAVDVVVAFDIDRLAREQIQQAVLIYEAQRAGARYEFVKYTFEDTPTGKFMLAARSFVAEVEREQIRERTVRGKVAKLRSGHRLRAAKAPYGFRYDGAEMLIDAREATVVQRIYQELRSGGTLRGIAHGLVRDGIPTPKGGDHWSVGTIGRLLRNPLYHGRQYAWIHGRPPAEWIDLPPLPPIVDSDTWAAVQAQLARNKELSPRNSRHPDAFLLRGVAFCGTCGRRLSTYHERGVAVYTCPHDRVGVPCQARAYIPAHRLDGAAVEFLTDLAEHPDRYVRPDSGQEHDGASIAAELASIDRKMARAAKAYLDLDGHALEAIRAELDALGKRKSLLEERLRAVRPILRTIPVIMPGQLITYEHRRMAVQEARVVAHVYPPKSKPRFTFRIDL